RRRRLTSGQNHHIFAAIVAESAQAVKKRQIARGGFVWNRWLVPVEERLQLRNQDFRSPPALGLFGQRSSVIHEDDSRHRLQEIAVVVRHLFAAAHKNAAGAVEERSFGTGGDE